MRAGVGGGANNLSNINIVGGIIGTNLQSNVISGDSSSNQANKRNLFGQ
jgi:hypothetical protein